jgi:hypothetical protein
MLNALAIVLFVGLMMQIALPMPGQEPGAATNGSDKATQMRKGDRNATNPPATLPPIQPDDSGNKGQSITSQDKEQAVKLTNIPPITIVEKDKTWKDRLFDWGPWVFNLLLVIVGAVGVWLARRTLGTMDRQADSLRQQVEDARRANTENAETAVRTLQSIEAQAAMMTRQAELMDSQLNEMREAGKQAARHLSLTQRPWISMSVSIVGPLVSDDQGVHITVRIQLANVGSSPAIGVMIHPVFYLVHVDRPHPKAERDRLCGEIAARPPIKGGFGPILFPNVFPAYVQDWTFGTSPEELTKYAHVTENAEAVADGPYVNVRNTAA